MRDCDSVFFEITGSHFLYKNFEFVVVPKIETLDLKNNKAQVVPNSLLSKLEEGVSKYLTKENIIVLGKFEKIKVFLKQRIEEIIFRERFLNGKDTNLMQATRSYFYGKEKRKFKEYNNIEFSLDELQGRIKARIRMFSRNRGG